MPHYKFYKNQWNHTFVVSEYAATFWDGESPSITLETKNGKLVNKCDHPYFGETVKELLEGYDEVKE